MNLLSIQGHFAPAYRLSKTQENELMKCVREITGENEVVVISSKYRTDLMFRGLEDHMEEIIRTWCRISGITFKDATRLKFFRSSNELVALTQFFYRLYLLSCMPLWYKMYYEQLLGAWMKNPKDPILCKIIKVMTSLNDLLNEHSVKLNENDFKQIAIRFINPESLVTTYETRAN